MFPSCLKVLSVFRSSSWRANGRWELGEDGLHEDGAHIRLRSVSLQPLDIRTHLYFLWLRVTWSELNSFYNDAPVRPVWCRHPSRLQDNMMPMSPDDYRALAQYVSPRDLAVVVSSQSPAVTRCSPGPDHRFVYFPDVAAEYLVNWQRSVCLFLPLASPPDQQSDLWIWGHWPWGR